MQQVPVGPATIIGYGSAAGAAIAAALSGGNWRELLAIVAAALVAWTNAGRQYQARPLASEPTPSSRPQSAATPDGAATGEGEPV